mmetsp:Transcript_29364/g.45378  ORF Transcript_29364/g.45378 Transcript_29364/m.45378 type:complete len:202 (+) Transcript_29364:1675-2280(+)
MGRVLRSFSGPIKSTEKLLSLKVLLDVGDLVLRTSSLDEVLQGSLINREETHGGSILGGHIGEGSAVFDRHGLQSVSEVLNELSDTSVLPQFLSNSKHQIGGGSTRGELSLQLEPNNLREDHTDLLTTHDSLSLQTSNTPSANTKTVNHRSVRVSSNNGVRVQHTVLVKDRATEKLKIDLMDNTSTRGDDEEIIKRLSTPL